MNPVFIHAQIFQSSMLVSEFKILSLLNLLCARITPNFGTIVMTKDPSEILSLSLFLRAVLEAGSLEAAFQYLSI